MNAAAVFAKIDRVKPVYDFVYKILFSFCKILLIATIFVTCWMVAGRYIPFLISPAWTEEVILALMVYMSLLSAALALRRRGHIRMVALDPLFNKTLVKCLDVLADVLIMGFAVLLITQGWTFATNIGARGSFTSMPNVSLFWRFLPVPLGGFFMVFFNLEVMYNNIKAFFIKGDGSNDS